VIHNPKKMMPAYAAVPRMIQPATNREATKSLLVAPFAVNRNFPPGSPDPLNDVTSAPHTSTGKRFGRLREDRVALDELGGPLAGDAHERGHFT